MADESGFSGLMERLRAGDQDAATEMMNRYGAEVQRLARLRLRSGQMRRVLESSDVLQSVMFSFFRRADLGEYEQRLQTPDELLKLLATMVRYKVIDQARKAHSERRGGKMDIVELMDSMILQGDQPMPEDLAIQKELLGIVQDVLTADEWQLWQLRYGEKLDWAEIAGQLGGTGESQRKKLERLQIRLRSQFADVAGE